MRTRRNRIALLVVVLLASGCLMGSGGTPRPEDTGKLLVSAHVPTVFRAHGVTAQSVLDDITLAEIVFTVSKGTSSQTVTVSVTPTEDPVEAAFANLAAGTWTIDVVAVDTDDFDIATGTATASVGVGTTTDEEVTLNILPGTLSVQLTAQDDSNIVSGKVSLLVSDMEESFPIASGETHTVDFGEVTAQIWLIKAELYHSSSAVLYGGQSQIPVLPGRPTTAHVVFDQEAPGGLSITIIWNLPPDRPTAVNAVYDDGEVTVSWSAVSGAVGYMVIRSLTEDGHGIVLTDSPIAETSFVDAHNLEEGTTYWYRVIAYDAENVSSHFSESVSVTIHYVAGTQTTHTAEGVSFNMRLAPAATFPTGVDDDGEATVDTDFWIAETPVTYELWYAVRQWATHADRGDTKYTFANVGREGSHGNEGQAPSSQRNQPVTVVSWRDSIVWSNALAEMFGYQPVYTYDGHVIRDATNATACDSAVVEDTKGFRLPTSDEWELAARYKGDDSSDSAIPRGGLYWTPGNYASGAADHYDNASATQDVAWYSANSGGSTQDVATVSANQLGLHDMSGNVWEWCFTQNELQRVNRGGSWYVHSFGLRIGLVGGHVTDLADEYVGLRLVRTQ